MCGTPISKWGHRGGVGVKKLTLLTFYAIMLLSIALWVDITLTL